MKRIFGCGVLAMLVLAPVCLPADQAVRPEAALIVYAAGTDIEIRNAGGAGVEAADLIGHPLFQGDTLITGEDSFVEIQLSLTRNVIKIAENTTFQLQRLEKKQESVFEVLYGSVRARVRKLGRSENFTIRGGDAIAGVRGTDFGLNVLVDRERADAVPVTEVYCFAGKIQVEPLFELSDAPAAGTLPGGTEKAALVLRDGEMVRVSRQNPEGVYEKLPIQKEIRNYWEGNSFQGRLLSSNQQLLQPPEVYTLEEKHKKLVLAGSALLSAGLIMEFSGAISLAAGNNYSISDSLRRRSLKNSGIALISGGSFLLTSSLVTFLRSAAVERNIRKAGSAAAR
jgi:hypothetical protein